MKISNIDQVDDECKYEMELDTELGAVYIYFDTYDWDDMGDTELVLYQDGVQILYITDNRFATEFWKLFEPLLEDE